MDKLFANTDDFRGCIDRGLALMHEPENAVPPDEADLEKMRGLLAIFITATMDMDPNAHKDPDWPVKITSVRMALLAAYNLGKQAN